MLGASEEIPVKIIPAQLRPEEIQGLYQVTDVKLLIDPGPLNGYYPQTTDFVKYNQNGRQRTAKIIGMMSYRGDNPILHVVIARLS